MQGISGAFNHICDTFYKDLAFGIFITVSISMAIVVVNTIFSYICFYLISKIGYHKESKIAQAIMTCYFVIQFFNTAILILIVNAYF